MGYLIIYKVITSILCVSPSWETVLCVCCMHMHREISYQTFIKTVVYFPGIHICAFYPIPWLRFQVEQKSLILSLFNQRKHRFFNHNFISPLSSSCVQTILWPIVCASRVEHSWAFWCLGASDDNGCRHKKHELQQKQQSFIQFVFMWFNNWKFLLPRMATFSPLPPPFHSPVITNA